MLVQPAGAIDAANLALTGRVVIDVRSLYSDYTPNITNQKVMLGHIVSRAATELSYIERSSFTKDVTIENNSTFVLPRGDVIGIPIYVKVEFMRRDQFNQQHQSIDTLSRPSVVNAQCSIGCEKYPDAGMNCIYAIDKSF